MTGTRVQLVIVVFLLALQPGTSATAQQFLSASEQQLNSIIAEYWDFHLQENPTEATQIGINDFNDRMPVATRANQLRQQEAEGSFLRRTLDIDRDSLSQEGLINADVFEWVLQDSIGAYELNLSRIPFNTFSGFFMEALTASSGVSMKSVEDYEDYLARLADIPRYFDENLDNMRVGVREDFVLPQVVVGGILPTIQAQLKDDPASSSFFDPFRGMSARVAATEQERLRQEARDVIGGKVMPAFAEVSAFLQDEYQASESIGAEQLANGKDFYAFQIKRYTTLVGASAEDIHAIGLAEVARIRLEMLEIIEELGYDGDFRSFSKFLRGDERFYAKSEEQLLKEVAYVAKRIDHLMPGFFGKLPRQSYGIVPVPAEIAPNYTTGAYYGAPPGGSHGGEFWVNTYGLDQRPLYEIPALTLHEAVPGHHHQNALALEMHEVPDFRRNLYFSAFGEGWALYAEKLGVEMGIYQTPYENFGRLSYEMWRACRLVIDTGIHSQGWTRQQAIDYLTDNTSLSLLNARSEVDRYISWPGQALAYKLGELKVWQLRHRAEQKLGDLFDLREFHDVVLGNGALPMAMMEAVVDRYIGTRLAD